MLEHFQAWMSQAVDLLDDPGRAKMFVTKEKKGGG